MGCVSNEGMGSGFETGSESGSGFKTRVGVRFWDEGRVWPGFWMGVGVGFEKWVGVGFWDEVRIGFLDGDKIGFRGQVGFQDGVGISVMKSNSNL